MFFYIILTPISTTSVYEVPAIRVNTTKLTYTFTTVYVLHAEIVAASGFFLSYHHLMHFKGKALYAFYRIYINW